MLIIKNCNLISMAKVNYEIVDILVEGEKIKAIGKFDVSSYPDAKVIDAAGRYVTPGFIENHCHVGIGEAYVRSEGADYNEITNPITPELRAIDAIKPKDPHFDEALQAGVTTVAAGPGSANLIGGTFCVLKTNTDDRFAKRVIKEEVGMKMALGENPKRCYAGKGPSTRMANAAVLRDALKQAKLYKEAWDKYVSDCEKGEKATKPAYNCKWESLKRVFEGLPVKIHCHQQDDILTAISIMKEFGLESTLEHTTDGRLVVEEIKAANQKCCVGPYFIDQMKWEVRNVSPKTPAVLFEHGVEFSIITDAPVVPLTGLLFQLALAVKNGLPELEAFKAATITPARFLHIEDRVGSIEEGKDADIVIWSEHPLNSLAWADCVIVNGDVKYQR